MTGKVDISLKYVKENVLEHVRNIFKEARPTNFSELAAIQFSDELVWKIKNLNKNTKKLKFVDLCTNDEARARSCDFLNKRLTTNHSLMRFPLHKKIATRGLISSTPSLKSAVMGLLIHANFVFPIKSNEEAKQYLHTLHKPIETISEQRFFKTKAL